MAPSMNVDYSERKELISKNLQRNSDTMMGKTQKFSTKGHSSGFVSDYRHAVGNMAVSEGLGSSGRVEAEMTASEDSSAPKRKCISLNVDTRDSYGIPLEVFSVPKMSRYDRKQLELRLKLDLDRVRNMQKKITMQFANVVPVSSSSDIRSGSNGRKEQFYENIHQSSGFLSKQGNKKVPFGRNSHDMKQDITGRFESVKQEIQSSAALEVKLMEQCEALLKRVMTHNYGWVFNAPVDVVKLKIPDYFTVIKHPMDLGTVKSKIASGQYSSPRGFLADVRLTFSNAMTYNPPTNDVHFMAKTLSKFFEQRWKNIQKKLPPIDSVLMPAKSSVSRESKAPVARSPPKKRKISTMDHEVRREPAEHIMTEVEKQNLSMDLESLQEELPAHIIDFLTERSFSEAQPAGEDEEIMVDIDVLSDDALFTLRKLVDNYLQEKQRHSAKVELREPEILNESGLKSTLQPSKGHDLVDEDVDIGGNDLPVLRYPPVEIEKDTAHGNSKYSSSSGDSSSSSSESDRGSSSSSDTDGAKVSSLVNTNKEAQTKSYDHSHNGNQSLSGLDQLEQNPQTKPVSYEADNQQAEEIDLPERHVSPEKLYRAALLRSRFADTILKAREKSLDKGEKGDPEKLQREREELERQQREEKAQLQAEAKAAEDARRQAEGKAAAEAKRKRELDREAARQALLKMEKTVEINENCNFLEDLEMLRSAPVCHLPLADVTTPDHSSDGMGGFQIQGNNPLEQLGLYMKMDDEEEEECEPTSVSEPVNDVEEGEID